MAKEIAPSTVTAAHVSFALRVIPPLPGFRGLIAPFFALSH